jgi:molecular chaperone Hsp33
MTDSGGFRVIATTLRDTVSQAAATQSVAGPMSIHLAEVMASAILLRETTQPGRRVQIALRDSSGGSLIADSLANGVTRGLVNPGRESRTSLSPDAILKVSYSQPKGGIHVGVVSVERSDISKALMTYLQESEQILSFAAVAAVGGGDALVAAGFVVQLLPEIERAALAAMTERLGDLEALTTVLSHTEPSADDLIERVFDGFEHTILADSRVRFGCNCSMDRILAGLATLGADEIRRMIAAGAPLEIRCDACGKDYEIAPDALTSLPV